jgi:putative peptidoglycan lipid II flippase
MTFISRVLGLIRDGVIAHLLGASASADVYIFANKIPNFLRRLFAEGAFSQAFIPVLTEVQHQKYDKQLKQFISKAAGTLGIIVTLTSIVGVIASPLLVGLFATGWFMDYLGDGEHADKFELASLMLKITFPYLMFITLAGLAGAILNSLNRFAITAFTPALLNVSIICAAIFLSDYFTQPAYALAWGVFIGGILQLVCQLPSLAKAGLLVRPRWGWRDENVSKVRKLMIPALFGVSVGQLNLLLDTVIASFLVTGSISWLYYSDRLLEFPLGLFGIAIATVILPSLSRNHVSEDKQAFANNLDWAVRMVCVLGIPAAAGLIALAEPLLLVIFQRGAFSIEDAQMASYSLMAYGSGLLFFMLVKVLAPGFFSRQDTKTPVRYGIWCMASNMVMNLILVVPFGYVGLAMATTLSAAMNAALLYSKLHRTQVFRISRTSLAIMLKVLISAIGMALLTWHFSASFDWHNLTFLARYYALLQVILASVTTFVVAIIALGVRPRHFRH